MNLTLQRTVQSADGPTFGTITNQADGSVMVPVTLELPDRGNQPDVSRVVAGTFTFHRTQSHDIGYEVFETQEIPGRSGIAVHILNVMGETKGCIGTGEEQGELDGQPAILESKKAFDLFMGMLTGIDSFVMEIRDVVT